MRAYLWCDHCGSEAVESDGDGMFWEGETLACLTCGIVGHVSVDEGEPEPRSAYWMETGDRCARRRCHYSCNGRRVLQRHGGRRWLGQEKAGRAVFATLRQQGIHYEDPEGKALLEPIYQPVAHRKRFHGEARR